MRQAGPTAHHVGTKSAASGERDLLFRGPFVLYTTRARASRQKSPNHVKVCLVRIHRVFVKSRVSTEIAVRSSAIFSTFPLIMINESALESRWFALPGRA